MALLRAAGVALAVAALAACGSATAPDRSSTGAGETTTVAARGPSIAALLAFRDAAAAAPYWATVDWGAPTTTGEAARGFDHVAVGVVRSGEVDAPRPDDLVPYEGAPTLYHLEVTLQVEPRDPSPSADEFRVRVPVLASGAEGLARARPDAERIAAAAPVGATGVFLVDKGGNVQPVAFESGTGELVAYYKSMDPAVAHLTRTQLANALARVLAAL